MKDKTRRDLFKLGGILGALSLVRQVWAAPPNDRETEERNQAHAVAGTWMVQIEFDDTLNNQGSQGTLKTAMCQFHLDGRWAGSASAVNQGSSENWPVLWRKATYHGEWKLQGGPRFKIQAIRINTDDSGYIVATATTTIRAVLDASGQKWSGTFETGVGTETFTGKLDAQRM